MNKIKSIMAAQYKFNTNYDLKGVKLLIIDDDVGLANSIKYFFEDLNCNVFVSYSGEGGVQKFIKEKPDIVIVDLNMPGMTGHEVISFLSKHHSETPIVVVSGTGIIKEAIKSIKIGAWDFVTKPILNFEELEMSVLKALEKAQLITENKNYRDNLEKLVHSRTEQLEHKSKQLEKTIEELERTREKLLATDGLKNEFLAQISHEIRTPINILLGYSEILRMEFENKLSDNFEYSYNVVKKASSRIIRTIEMILQMSELISGAYNVVNEEANLNEMVEEVFNKYVKSAEDKNLLLVLQLPDDKIVKSIDRFSVDIMITQLIENAIKFTHQGKIEISLLHNEEVICIQVKDSGIGIAEAYLPKLFELFSQEDQGYSRGYEGNGLGLALVKKYSELNNIEIRVESAKGVGSVFQLVFSNSTK